MASHPTARGRSGSQPRRPVPRARLSPPSRCLPPAPGRPRRGDPHPTWRPRRRPPRPARPPPPAPISFASPLASRCQIQDTAALVRRGIENGHTTGLIGGRDLGRVDQGLTVDGVREVLDAVVANTLGEPQARRLLLDGPLSTQRARRLERLARIDGLREHLLADVDAKVVVALRARVWEVGDAVRSHALGEPHRLLLSGELCSSAAARGPGAAGVAGAAGGAAVGRCVRTAASADQRDRGKRDQADDTEPADPDPTGRYSWGFAVGHAAIEGSVVLPARMQFSIRQRYERPNDAMRCVYMMKPADGRRPKEMLMSTQSDSTI